MKSADIRKMIDQELEKRVPVSEIQLWPAVEEGVAHKYQKKQQGGTVNSTHQGRKVRLAFAVVIATAMLVVASMTPQVATALQQLFRYVPGIGLVENQQGIRVLKEPVSQTRDGITLTLKEVVANPDMVKLAYQVEGIPTGVQYTPQNGNNRDNGYCLGEKSYPVLVLPDGTELEANPQRLGGAWTKDSSEFTSGHLFPRAIPEDHSQVRFELECLSELQRGTVPEDWQLTFSLIPSGELMSIGEEVLEAGGSEVSSSGITLSVDKLIKEEDGYMFYTDLSFDQTDPTQLNLSPSSVFVYDSRGEKHLVSQVFVEGPWNVYDRNTIEIFKTDGIPAKGDLTLVVEEAYAYYSLGKNQPWSDDAHKSMSFPFEAGSDPHLGQEWSLSKHFEYGDHEFEVVSAKMIREDGKLGYEFGFQTSDPDLAMNARLSDYMNQNFWTSTLEPHGSTFYGKLLYEDEVPAAVEVTIDWISVVVDGPWEVTWAQFAE